MSTEPKLDLILERIVDVTPDLVWMAWTQPEHLKKWFTPAPWTTVEADIDLRPGGLFRTVMRSPDGQDSENIGCFLEVVPHKRLIWTDALEADFRPSRAKAHLPFRFTAKVQMEAHERGTKYTALVMHRSEEDRNQHHEMGFHDGWGTTLDQLVEYVKKVRSTLNT